MEAALESTESAVEAWASWRGERVVRARAPYGPLALTGTWWLDEQRANGWALPGRWTVDEQAGKVTLTAARHDGIAVDDAPLEGEVRLCPDEGPGAPRVSHGGRLLQLIVREDRYAVRVFDPASRARSAFAGIAAFPYDPSWAVPARYVPFPAERPVRVLHSDGRRRATVLAGELTFRRGAQAHAVAVQRAADGALSVSMADATRAGEACGFRVVEVPAPDADGRTLVDFNRAALPPSAFADHFTCPLPTEGNTLGFPVAAGERRLLRHR
jgi:uncharacterized protein (DUF1684 family)